MSKIVDMHRLDSHPLAARFYDMSRVIEALGGSPELTAALNSLHGLRQEVEDELNRLLRNTANDARMILRLHALAGSPPTSQIYDTCLPQDVINLVIAAREFWEVNEDMSLKSYALDKALEAFAERVPYENEPDVATEASGGDE